MKDREEMSLQVIPRTRDLRVIGTLIIALSLGFLIILPLALSSNALTEEQQRELQEAGRLNQLAMEARSRGDYLAAEQDLRKSLAILEEILGPNSIEVARSLNNLGEIYLYTGEFAKAEPLLLRALEIKKAVLGPEDLSTATTLNNLGSLYIHLGEFAKAETHLLKTLAIRERELGMDDRATATVLSNLGALYRASGDFAQAESYYQRALKIEEKIDGPQHPNTAMVLNNLATVYLDIGDFDQAAALYKRALEIMEKVNPAHPMIAKILNNLAQVYMETKDHTQAEAMLKRALAILSSDYPGHPDLAGILTYLAHIHLMMGDYAGAKAFLKRAMAIMENAAQADPSMAPLLNEVAGLYLVMGSYEEAELNFQKALSIYEQLGGEELPAASNVLSNLAILRINMGQTEKAFQTTASNFGMMLNHAENVFSFASERQKLLFREKMAYILNIYLSIALSAKDNGEILGKSYEAVIQSKGILLEVLVGEREAVRESLSPELKAVFEELVSVRSQIAELYVRGPGDNLEAYKKRLAALEARKEELESQISRGSAEFRSEQERRRAGFSQVCRQVPAGSALIDYVQFTRYEPPEEPGLGKWTPWLVAFVVKGGDCGAPTLIDLGPLQPIQAAVSDWRKALKADKPVLMARGKALSDLVWKPVAAKLPAGVKAVFISPDGPLHLIPFAALPAADGRYLIESIDLSYVTVAKDFLGPVGEPAKPHEGIFILGGANFDLREAGPAAASEPGASRGLRGNCPLLGNLSWPSLSGTETEARQIGGLAQGKVKKITLVTGNGATEAAVREASSRVSILHLATHGFFLADLCAAEQESRGPKRDLAMEMVGQEAQAGARTDNPLLLSGLALAGANHAALVAGDNDGVLLALEVANLDLRGMKLVVLSACDTGLGEVQRGEGVFGLKRSFISAGAESLVVSLWSVPDRETQQLMTAFYQRLFAGQDPGRALREAQLAMIQQARQSGHSDHPFFWAAFQSVQ